MKRWMHVACAAALACGACTRSQVASEADIQVTGQVLQEDKQPVANTLLTFSRSANSSCIFSFLFGDPEWKSVKTGTDGSFSQTWLGADTKSGTLARCFSLQTPRGAKGSVEEVQFTVQSEQLQLPLLQQWSGATTATAAAEGVDVSFKAVSETQPDVGTTHPILHVQHSLNDVWVMDAQGSPTRVNDDLLEDARSLEASVQVQRSVTSGKNTFELFQRSDSVDLPQRTHVPLSRGASCTYPEAPTPCPLTDGDLGTAIAFKSGTRQVLLQLARPQVLRKAILRHLDVANGKPLALVLEGSTDGTLWIPLANLLDSSSTVRPYIEAPLSSSTALSQVRLSLQDSSSDPFIIGLSELSLF